MNFHPGRLRVFDPQGAVTADGPCRAALTDDGLVIEPEGFGGPTYLYYSDIDRLMAEDYELRLTGFDGSRRVLYFLGSYYGQFAKDLSDRRREQLLKNLLLTGGGAPVKDFGGAYHLDGGGEDTAAGSGAARILLYRGSLVVFPEADDPFAFGYADLTGLSFDQSAYSLVLTFDLGERLVLSRLGDRFREFQQEVTRLRDDLFCRSADLLKAALPPGTAEGTLVRLSRVLPLGRAASRSEIEGVSAGLWDRLVAAAVAVAPEPAAGSADDPSGSDEASQPGSDGDPGHHGDPAALAWLAQRSQPGLTYLGVREPSRSTSSGTEGDVAGTGSGPASDAPLFWFVVAFPDRNAMASEVLGETGHATYFFRLSDQAQAGAKEVDQAVRRLARALRALNFRREVILAKDADLADDRMIRYRVALRKLPYLRAVRRAFLGRAIHRGAGAWEKQAERLLGP